MLGVIREDVGQIGHQTQKGSLAWEVVVQLLHHKWIWGQGIQVLASQCHWNPDSLGID